MTAKKVAAHTAEHDGVDEEHRVPVSERKIVTERKHTELERAGRGHVTGGIDAVEIQTGRGGFRPLRRRLHRN